MNRSTVWNVHVLVAIVNGNEFVHQFAYKWEHEGLRHCVRLPLSKLFKAGAAVRQGAILKLIGSL